MKPKSTRKIPEAPKNDKKIGPPLLRGKRVFGTARNPNIPSTTASKNPAKGKPSSGPLKNAAKPFGPPTAEAKSSSGKNRQGQRKKSVCFQENEIEKNGNVVEPQTPLKSPAAQAKPRLSAQPHLIAIKLAETVGKHFVSAVFFRLAFDCEAEPIRNIRVELKKYLARHEYLNGEEEWKKLSVSYGLMKEESSVNPGKLRPARKKKMQVLTSKKMRIW
ncbi:hypothetical protein DH2020_000158 [Rehmannia glutinosa]|uniref:Uncharacterized protein n=1 Tax=Rehmannia glutinosa TaxID=99300 RepID=A0ABR0XVU0_REHGL